MTIDHSRHHDHHHHHRHHHRSQDADQQRHLQLQRLFPQWNCWKLKKHNDTLQFFISNSKMQSKCHKYDQNGQSFNFGCFSQISWFYLRNLRVFVYVSYGFHQWVMLTTFRMHLVAVQLGIKFTFLHAQPWHATVLLKRYTPRNEQPNAPKQIGLNAPKGNESSSSNHPFSGAKSR